VNPRISGLLVFALSDGSFGKNQLNLFEKE